MESTILIDNIYTIENNDCILFKRIYNYYYYQGIKNIILLNINSLFIKYFLLGFIILLTTCIDYTSIYNLNKDTTSYLTDFIKFNHNNLLNNGYFIICILFYLIYLVCCTINTFYTIKNSYKTKSIVNNVLNIKDKEFKYKSWNDIVKKIVISYSNPNLNIYTINSKICLDDNITIDLFRSKFINIPHITQFLEWNFIFCFVNSLFDKANKITSETLYNYNQKVLTRLKLIFIINLITMPFSIFIVIIYNLINYGESIYNNPEIFLKRIWNAKSKWRLKYYNELPHEFETRLELISNDINKVYFKSTDKGLLLIFKFINFILGSLFITIVMLSILNENILFNCYIYKTRTVLWVLGIIGTFILIIKKINKPQTISKETKTKILENIKQNMGSTNPNWFTLEMYNKTNKFLSKMYQSKIYFIIQEIIYVILSPYFIYQWHKEFESSNFNINDYIDNHYILNNISKKSIFTNINILKQDPHVNASYIEFHKNNPEWDNYSIYFKNDSKMLDASFNWDNNQNLDKLSDTQLLNSSYLIPNDETS